MTTYREQFDQQTATAISAVANITVELNDELPGLKPGAIRRLLASISTFLAYVDKGNVRHPEYLAHSPEIIPEFAIKQVANIQNSVASGASYFVQTTLPTLLLIEDRLIKAVGIDGHRVKEIKNQQVIDLQGLADTSREATEAIQRVVEAAEDARQKAEAGLAEILEQEGRAAARLGEIVKMYDTASRLSSGDARKNSLERLARTAREKSDEIEAVLKGATQAKNSIDASATAAASAAEGVSLHLKNLADTEAKANEILRGATQAGLAGAYNTERNRLAKEQRLYAYVFYGGVITIILYAAIFIIPVFAQILQHGADRQTQIGESALLLLVRIVILAPMIWALIFTNKRYSKLETLQMDYAAKAATALAYSGYKDEMGADPHLAAKLQDGLLVRFLEHPERLLNRSEMKETVGITSDGLSYSSTNAPAGATVAEPGGE